MLRSILPLSLCLATALLAGCGQKGPLYYAPPTPAKPAAASSTVKPAVPAKLVQPAPDSQLEDMMPGTSSGNSSN